LQYPPAVTGAILFQVRVIPVKMVYVAGILSKQARKMRFIPYFTDDEKNTNAIS
jgi:hypothetical protein